MSARFHVFGGERLQAFSDAVFAIVATIMVIPLKIDKNDVDDSFNLEKELAENIPQFFIYLFSFILVVDIWYSHSRLFSIVEQVDDVLLWLNLLCLLFISFLPYGIALVSRFTVSRPDGFFLAVSICSITIILTGAAMVVMLLYAFRKQSLLHPEVVGNADIRTLKVGLLLTLLVSPALAILAQIFAYIPYKAFEVIALISFYSMGVTSFATRTFIHFYNKRRKLDIPEFATTLFRTIANKSRTEAFSDGVFSIVATLLVLDFSTQIPTIENVRDEHNDNLKDALHKNRYIYLAYISSFMIVGLLWFVQYSMFHFIKKMTPPLSFINTVTLSLVCGIPIVTGMYVIFDDIDDSFSANGDLVSHNQVVAIRTSVVLIFLVGVFQLLFWTVALYTKTECLHEVVDKYPAEMIQFLKIMIMPTVCAIIYLASFSTAATLHHIFGAVVVITPFLFLLVKAVFRLQEKYRNTSKFRVQTIKSRLRAQGDRRGSQLVEAQDTTPYISSPINEHGQEKAPLKGNVTSTYADTTS